jgi:hypothetical protein
MSLRSKANSIIEQRKKVIMDETVDKLYAGTPKRSGHLASDWKANYDSNRIENNVPYGPAVNARTGFVGRALR